MGITLGGIGRDIFREERNSVIEKAQKKALTLNTYIKKSYDVTSVGKALWKQQAVPAIMFGKQIVILNKKIKEKLQVIENNVYRNLLGVGPTTPVETLRGEIGASEVDSRVMETVLMFARDTLQGKFEDIKGYMTHDLESGKGRWAREIKKLEQELELGQDELKTISKKELKTKIRGKDTKKWEEIDYKFHFT